jgi:PAS domain S-box-containing protein
VSDVTFVVYPRLAYGGEIMEETRAEARIAERFLKESEFDSVLFAMEAAFDEDENFYGVSRSLKPRMEPIIASYKEKMQKLISMLDVIADGVKIKPDDFLNSIYDARNFFVLMDYAALDELDVLLATRIDHLERQQWRILFWYALAQAAGLLLFGLLTTSVTTPINRLYRAIVGITAGDLKVDVPSQDFQDEIGKIARGVESFRLNALEKVRLEMALKAESDYLQSIMDSSVDGIIVMNDKGFILNFNSAAQRMFGYSAVEVMGKNISFLMPEKSPFHYGKYIGEYLNDVNLGLAGISREVEGQRKNGSIFPIDMALSRLVHGDSQIYFVGLFKDISERKTMEAELIEHRDHLQKLVNMQTIDLIIEKEKAERASIAKSEFLSNMSHELRTPMHAILNYASMALKLIRDEPDGKLHKYLGNIETAGTRLLALLNSLLDIEKLEADKVEFNFKQADLSKVIDYAELELDSLIKAKGLRVAKLYRCGDCHALFDEVRIIQVLVNLLSNAIKFSPEGGTINITLTEDHVSHNGQDSPALLCVIEDSGVGIPRAELESIFDKFVQSSKTKTTAGGTGLGLSISRKIIEKHGGKIWAENVRPKGAAFKFLLPRG